MDCRYNLTMMVSPDDAFGFDSEYALYRLLNSSTEARIFLNLSGKATGNDGYWREFEHDMRMFSKTMPEVTFFFEVETYYETRDEQRYWFRNGKMLMLEPIMAWPEFREEDMK